MPWNAPCTETWSMSHSSRSAAITPVWPWLGRSPNDSPRTYAARGAGSCDLASTSLGARYWVDGSSPRPGGCTSHRATRRFDDMPVSIVIPDGATWHKFVNAMPFVQVAREARRLRHPYVLRTLEAGFLYDGRPFAVVERPPTESFSVWIAHRRRLPWPQVRSIALRLCSAIEAARRRGLAPRNLDLDGCLRVRDGVDGGDIRLGELFVLDSARLPETDAPAIAMIVHALGGGGSNRTEAGALGNVLIRALGNNGYADVREMSKALAAIGNDGTRESQGANHAAVAGEFAFDEIADVLEERSRPSFVDVATVDTLT